MDVWLSIAETAPRLGVSKMTIYRLVHEGELVAHKFGRTFRIREEDLEAYIKKSKFQRPPKEDT